MNILHAGLFSTLAGIIREANVLFLGLLKIMVPIILLVKFITELELLPYLAALLEPLMHLMGLPGSMGLVWATAILNNVYSAMIVFVSLPESFELRVCHELSVTLVDFIPMIFVSQTKIATVDNTDYC